MLNHGSELINPPCCAIVANTCPIEPFTGFDHTIIAILGYYLFACSYTVCVCVCVCERGKGG